MKKIILIHLSLIALFMISACSQKKIKQHVGPDYSIHKPVKKYEPSKQSLSKMVKKLQGSPYVWAEEGPYNFDCSGFTYYLYGSMGIEIPRVSREQAKNGQKIDVSDLEYGDLIFFATSKNDHNKITHVGMYLGEGWFTHASTTKKEVVYSNLFESEYYQKKLRVCRRYLPREEIRLATKQSWETSQTSSEPEMIRAPLKTQITESSPAQEEQYDKDTYKKAIVIQSPMKEIEQKSSKGNFYVQVGSFIGEPKNELLNNIRAKNFEYKIIKFPIEDQIISRLLIGPYMTRDKTINILDEVRTTIHEDAFIAEIR